MSDPLSVLGSSRQVLGLGALALLLRDCNSDSSKASGYVALAPSSSSDSGGPGSRGFRRWRRRAGKCMFKIDRDRQWSHPGYGNNIRPNLSGGASFCSGLLPRLKISRSTIHNGSAVDKTAYGLQKPVSAREADRDGDTLQKDGNAGRDPDEVDLAGVLGIGRRLGRLLEANK